MRYKQRGTSLFRQSRPTLPAPSWFAAALDHKPEHSDIDVDGCRIHLRTWGDPEKPPLVLVHGGGAHSGWWDHIAPFFCPTHRVIAPDLSGHGDSESRPSYHLHTWAREVLAVSTLAGPTGQPTVVGHSLGGWVAARVGHHARGQIDSIVVIDSPLRDYAPEGTRLRNRAQRDSGYRSKEEIIARFTPVPSQGTVLPYIAHHIAAESVRRTLKGWFWKFDPAIFDAPLLDPTPTDDEMLERALAEMPCRIGYLRCQAGLLSPQMSDTIRDILSLRGPFVELAQAGHHPMLDQPLPLIAVLRTLLEFWSIT